MARYLSIAAVVAALVTAFTTTTTVPYAQERRVVAPVGTWEVRHGGLGHIYTFRSNGEYQYQRYGVQFGGTAQVLGLESGTYTVQGDLLILRPQGGGQKVFRWRTGPHPTSPNKPVLYLVDEDGTEEFFYQ